MRILIITSCTGEKAVSHERALRQEDFARGAKHLEKREAELAKLKLTRKASELYTGQQHVRLMRGIRILQGHGNGNGCPIDTGLWVLSAGYGLVPGDRELAPYECTFCAMKSDELRDWAGKLKVPGDFRKIVAADYDLALVLLSDDYLKACNIDDTVVFGGPTLILCGASVAKRLPKLDHLRAVVLSTPETKRFSCGFVGLKGEVAARLLQAISDGRVTPANAADNGFSLLDALDEGRSKQTASGDNGRQAPRFRFASFVPRTNARTLYFIPEWDDRVDPDYDFSCDGITQDRDPYSHDVYAHEIYSEPNYDGILVSKSVIEENKKKKLRIEQTGIHAHVRVPRNFPVMGDCGAFNYIEQTEPPYETEETVAYYDRLDFDYGVSIDHLIVPQHLEQDTYQLVHPDGRGEHLTKAEFDARQREGVRVRRGKPRGRKLLLDEPELYTWKERDLTEARRRWDLTLRNSEEFLRAHRKHKAKFVPIAGCQGWDIESQTEMFRLQQEMGYRYVALGGLVRSQTAFILELLESINKLRKPTTQIHVFGVARPEAVQDFVELGVDSVDSSRFLRQAWLSAKSNYYTGDPIEYARYLESHRDGDEDGERFNNSGWYYTAIRVPPIYREGSTTVIGKAKRLVEAGHSVDELECLERQTLDVLHAFDRNECELDETLKTAVAYDTLMGGDPHNETLYERVLEDKPWKHCPCEVCQRTGIDVLVFRRNNRNRRRGFHNTWWFFQFFKQMTGKAE